LNVLLAGRAGEFDITHNSGWANRLRASLHQGEISVNTPKISGSARDLVAQGQRREVG
jgi:hypothetical protein